MHLKIKRLRENAVLPQRMTAQSAGMDLSACLEAPLTIAPNETAKVPTGIAVQLEAESGYVLLTYARSSLATKHGLAPANCVGVIDLDYRGEIFIPLHNSSDTAYTISDGERIAQLVVTPIVMPDVVEADTLDNTERGEGGFGSTN
ncbi:dUTP pyrophosphatase [Ruminococcus sp. YE71]|uniref:dUTP diphosphatase n=1 Tax=unclassified Ruminococcus TaxID=2608920 RepID=UPI00087F439D|nr:MULTISPECIES: dUTP diphosphatase [unclassified Ruminococcus]SDA15580.1 dUTP pyrophosphatase [Ruminococcus sp. YE78]SFW22827.1 dUTP pyrophosphatase [Ruminococcus sp. YE71]